MASAGLNWYPSFEPLSRHFNVVAPDLRGHARGLRTSKVFRLADCADDCAATLVELGYSRASWSGYPAKQRGKGPSGPGANGAQSGKSGPVIAVGYSMGGPVAQLFWRRHRDLCDGLVLCATSTGFMPIAQQRMLFTMTMAAAVATTRAGTLMGRVPGLPHFAFNFGRPQATMPEWAAAEFRRHDWRMLVEAGHSLGTFHSGRWINEVDVPASVIVTTADRAVSPSLQRNLAQSIPSASTFTVNDGHLACVRPSFTQTLERACADVAERAARVHA
jgi:pimeloyl-ACP methyl ester carboxylesterase